jgi:hypothetical protein
VRVYRQAMRRGEDEKAALRVLVEGSKPTPAPPQAVHSVAA